MILSDAPTQPTREQQLTIVCDGWVEPRHPRKMLKPGNPEHVSHGMCPECAEALR